jgi:hypothetical protein
MDPRLYFVIATFCFVVAGYKKVWSALDFGMHSVSPKDNLCISGFNLVMSVAILDARDGVSYNIYPVFGVGTGSICDAGLEYLSNREGRNNGRRV